MRVLLAVGFAVLLSGVSAPALAQVPVTDSTVTSNTQRIASEVTNQVNLLREMKKVNQDTFKSVGNFGAQQPLSSLPAWDEFKNGGKLAVALKDYRPNTCAIVSCKGTSGGQEAQVTDYKKTREWVLKSLYAGDFATPEKQRDLSETRGRANREAAMGGYALSLTSREYLSAAGERGQRLEDIINASKDLRGDVLANSAVTVAQYQQQAHTLALLSSLVEMQATQGLRTDSTNPISGGGQVANTRQEGDYNVAGNRMSVSRTEEGLSTGQSTAFSNDGFIGPLLPPDVPSNTYLNNIKNQVGGGNSIINNAIGGVNTSEWSGMLGNAGMAAQVGAGIFSATGDYKSSMALSSLGSAMQNGTNNPEGILWAGAGTIASQSNDPRVWQAVTLGQTASMTTGQNSEMNQLMMLGQQAAMASGKPELMTAMAQTQSAYQMGQISNQEAANRATYYVSQSSTDPAGYAVGGYLNQNVKGATKSQLYNLGMSALKTSTENSKNKDYQSYGRSCW